VKNKCENVLITQYRVNKKKQRQKSSLVDPRCLDIRRLLHGLRDISPTSDVSDLKEKSLGRDHLCNLIDTITSEQIALFSSKSHLFLSHKE